MPELKAVSCFQLQIIYFWAMVQLRQPGLCSRSETGRLQGDNADASTSGVVLTRACPLRAGLAAGARGL